MSVDERHDVVVVGAGIVGAACAFRLAEAGLDVLVLERHEAPAMGSTGWSAAGVRVQFTEPTSTILSLESIREFATFSDRFDRDSGYRPIGYLLLVPEAQWEAHLVAVERQRSLGAPVEVLAVTDARRRFADFVPDGLAGATFGPIDGIIDPHSVTHAYLDAARALGARVRLRAEVSAIERRGRQWEVHAAGETHAGAVVLNAAGSWAGQIATLAGFDVPIVPVRRTVFATGPTPSGAGQPLTVDLGTGLYWRPEGERLIFGRSNHDQAPGFVEGVDWDWLEPTFEAAAARFPWFIDESLDRASSWFGYYEETPDHNPILGRLGTEPTWVNACGFSGHGVQQAPAVARAITEEIVDGHSDRLDIDAFRIERFRGETATSEQHVI